MPDQAPNIDVGPGEGRLVYDKARRTIVKQPQGKQALLPDHPLAPFGHHRLPHWLWRASPRAYAVVVAVRDIWLIATGRITLHRAFQHGYDKHITDDSLRRARGGK